MERLAVYGSLVSVIVVCYIYTDLLLYLRLEVVFPPHVLFHLLSFSVTNPGAKDLKALFACFAQCFGDLFVTCLILLKWPPPETWILLAQFFLLLLFVRTLKVPEVFDEFRNSYYRTGLFLAEAYLKSTSLAAGVQELLARQSSDSSLTYITLIHCVVLGMCKLTVGPAVSLVSTHWGVPWNAVPLRELKVQAKTGFFLCPMLMAIALATHDEHTDNWFFSTETSVVKAVANTYFMMLFTLDAVEPVRDLV
jgi:hypothetical protein